MAYILFTCSLTPSPPEVHVQRGYIRNTVWGDGDDAFAKPLFVWPCRHVQWLAAAREPNNQSWIIPRFCNIKGAWRIDMGFTGLPFLIHHFSTWCSLHSLHIFKREFYFLSFPALVLIQLWRFMIFLQRNLKFLCFFRNKNPDFFPEIWPPGLVSAKALRWKASVAWSSWSSMPRAWMVPRTRRLLWGLWT